MRPHIVHGVELDLCDGCGGTWFDADELRTLLQRDPHVLTELETMTFSKVEHRLSGPSLYRCPDCCAQLDIYHYMYNSPILLHACGRCGGLWVEESQLGQMQAWLDNSNQTLTSKDRSAAAMAEAVVQHSDEMRRQHGLYNFFRFLSIRNVGWYDFR